MSDKTEYDKYQEQLAAREWKVSDVPFYREGKPVDFTDYETLDYLDVYEKIWGRKCGENGLGRLREVALTVITEAENAVYNERYPFHQDLKVLEGHGKRRAEIPRLQEEQAAYAGILEANGVKVHWIDWGPPPMSAFGPMQAMWAASDLWVIRGGSVIQKPGWNPFNFGRSEYLARWAQHNLGIPILYTVTGKAVQEPATTMWFAEDVWVTGISCAYNEEGNRQLLPVIKRTCGVEDLEVHTVYLPTDIYFDRKTGLSGHLTNVMCALDIDKVLVFAPGVDTETHRWLRRSGYRVGEVDVEEQIKCTPTNIIPLEPGVVFMVKEAKRAIRTVRDMGVEVIEVPNTHFIEMGGSLHCRTLRIYREPGPFKHV